MARVKNKFNEFLVYQRWKKGMKRLLPDFMANQIINESILKGKSPVKPGRRFQKYSQSYKDQIQNKVTFFFRAGKLVAVSALGNKELTAFRASRSARSQNRKNKIFIRNRNTRLFANKRVSPVNLKLSGELLDSFTTSISGNKLKISFTDEKAKFHDRGTNKMPQRKMLPSRRGERFSRSIEKRLGDLASRVFKLARRRR